jgi:Leucine-rich repeat (LRR) protein
MMSTDTDDSLQPSARGSRRPYLLVAVLVAVVAVGLIVWALTVQQNRIAEERAAKALAELGAIVVMDGSRTHVASVNLSTVVSPESLAKAIELLPAMTELGALDVSRTAITDRELATVGQLTSLESLALGQTAISDGGLKQLAGLTQLRSLNLTRTPISGAGLSALSDFSRLKILDLSATKTADNLGPLARLPQLDWLVLRDVTLTEDALSDLSASESLTRLTLEGSKYPAESLRQLQQALPELSVDK